MTWLVVLSLILPPFEPPPYAVADAPAVRLDPAPVAPSFDATFDNGRCVGAEPLLAWFSPGWDVARMSRIMYRESRCRPAVRNRSGSTGLLQLMPLHCRWLVEALGFCSVPALQDPTYNIQAAAELWARDGYRPWAL